MQGACHQIHLTLFGHRDTFMVALTLKCSLDTLTTSGLQDVAGVTLQHTVDALSVRR